MPDFTDPWFDGDAGPSVGANESRSAAISASAELEKTVITPYRDGPLLVRGPFVLRDQEGAEIEVGRETVALCRCGKSRIRPFCDGTHKLTGFRAPSTAEDRVGPRFGREPA